MEGSAQRPQCELVECFTVTHGEPISRTANDLLQTLAENNAPGTTLVVTVHAWTGLIDTDEGGTNGTAS